MKHRLLEFLVTQMGFRSLVLEIDWGTGLQINDYILTGHGDPEQVIPSDRKDLTDYRMQEIVALLQWLRAYNANPQHTQKVQVVGMDLLALTPRIYDLVQDYVQHTRPDLLPEIVQSYTAGDSHESSNTSERE
jgi:erythromycin esterase